MVPVPRPSRDVVPHASEVLAALRACRQVIRDAQTEVAPFGAGYRACTQATASLEMLAQVIAGEPDDPSTPPFGETGRGWQDDALHDDDDLSF